MAQAQVPAPMLADSTPKPGYFAADGSISKPELPNPYLALLPEGARPADYAHWRGWLQQQGKRRAARLPVPMKQLALSESEPNDTQTAANTVSGFGSGAGDDFAADISATFSSPAAATLAQSAEDEGSIPLATDTQVTAGNAVRISATIGDGPYGNSAIGSGDFDFFRIDDVQQGQRILIDVDTPTPDPLEGLDSFVALYNSNGTLLEINDNDGGSTDSFLTLTAPATDDYFVSVGGFNLTLPILADPFDSSSGFTFGLGSEGDYTVTIGLDYGDDDYFSIELEAGDVLGVAGDGAIGLVQLFDSDEIERVGSRQDASFVYPAASPLPGGTSAVLAYLVETSGTYAVNALGFNGDYNLQLRVFRPALEQLPPGERQILFLDFDGAEVDAGIFGAEPGPVTLSPLASFLSGWGLNAADEDAVIDAIVAVVQENVDSDLRTLGNNPNFDVEIRNSRDHADPFGQEHVSRVIIGGSTSELGIPALGIAQSIDIGNFETKETAVVMLDLLSAPASDPNSLNRFSLDAGVSIIDLIGTGVGNAAAHEAGHFWGSFHTENFFTAPSLMDQGGNLDNLIGIGFDGMFGNEDDVDVDFGVDFYTPDEGFSGIEDTLNTTAFALSAGTGGPTPIPVGQLSGNGSFPATLVGQISAAQRFTLSSSGSADLIVSAVPALDDVAHFLLQNNNCTNGFNLGTSGSCDVEVSCAPQTEGVQMTTLRIGTNAGEFSQTLDCTSLAGPVLSDQIFSDQFE